MGDFLREQQSDVHLEFSQLVDDLLYLYVSLLQCLHNPFLLCHHLFTRLGAFPAQSGRHDSLLLYGGDNLVFVQDHFLVRFLKFTHLALDLSLDFPEASGVLCYKVEQLARFRREVLHQPDVLFHRVLFFSFSFILFCSLFHFKK